MAYPLLPLIFSTLFLPLLALAQSNGSVAVGKFLTANDTATPWLSPSRDFAFGFQKIRDKDTFLLCIWYDKIPDRAIVWYANEGTAAVPRDSRVEITAERGLVLSDPQGKELWNSESIVDVVANGFMNDTGNFVLVGGNSDKLWESFKNPTDTILPAQLMERGGVLYSRQAEANFSRGRFQLRLQNDGNLVLYPVDVPSDMAYDAYYASGTYNASNSSNPGYQVIFNETGHLYINLRRNGETFELTPQVIPSASENYYRATLNFDGVFAQYHYPKVFTGVQNWTQVWSKPDNICLNIRGDEGSGACGYNSVCTLGESRRPICECPRRFSLLDPSDKYGSCKPEFTQSCDADEPTSAEDLYDFEVLTDTDWPTSDYAQLRPYSEEDCRKSCLQDCFCAVAIYRGDSCWKKKLPLSNGRKDSSVNGKAFLKFRKGDLSPQPPKSQESKKDQGSLILVGSVLLGSSVFVNFVVIAAACLGFFLIYNKKVIRPSPSNNIVGDNLRCFTYKELVEATNGFKEELGRGAFGTVYKGTMQLVSRNIVAVKRLGNVVQDGDKEFNTEVNVIAQTHHKNLVRLLGFCNEADERLLVYEYMSNGSLAGFLFGDTKPSWDQRTHIALGIARGLSYLHEECSTQIIHCDIKPQNILLDDSYSARISDFGMAKLLMINQSRTNTAIRGTKGYVAPEWFRSTPVTVKVDVYSFGVLLLEITCCRRCVGDLEMAEEKAILTDWVWDCFREGRLDALVENDERALNDWEKFKRFVMVGIWCVQEDPSLRPAMKKIIQMLEGVVEVAVPPCPFPNFNSTSR